MEILILEKEMRGIDVPLGVPKFIMIKNVKEMKFVLSFKEFGYNL